MSTGTISSATRSTQLTASKNVSTQKPAAVTAANLAKFAATSSPVSSKITVIANSMRMATGTIDGCARCQNGTASQVSEKNAGMSTSPTKATSPQRPRLKSDSETA